MLKKMQEALHNFRENDTARKILKYNRIIFNHLLVTFIIVLITEAIWPMSVSSYLNINHFLMIIIVSGLPSHPILTISILGSLIIWDEIGFFGITAVFISISSGILIYILSNILVKETKNK